MKHDIDMFTSIEVKLDEEVDSYRVSIHQPLCMKKVRELSHTYSTDWTEQSIVQDVIKHYLH